MTKLVPSEQAFYEWWHANRTPGMSQDQAMAAFMAGWEAATEFIGQAVDQDPQS